MEWWSNREKQNNTGCSRVENTANIHELVVENGNIIKKTQKRTGKETQTSHKEIILARSAELPLQMETPYPHQKKCTDDEIKLR